MIKLLIPPLQELVILVIASLDSLPGIDFGLGYRPGGGDGLVDKGDGEKDGVGRVVLVAQARELQEETVPIQLRQQDGHLQGPPQLLPGYVEGDDGVAGGTLGAHAQADELHQVIEGDVTPAAGQAPRRDAAADGAVGLQGHIHPLAQLGSGDQAHGVGNEVAEGRLLQGQGRDYKIGDHYRLHYILEAPPGKLANQPVKGLGMLCDQGLHFGIQGTLPIQGDQVRLPAAPASPVAYAQPFRPGIVGQFQHPQVAQLGAGLNDDGLLLLDGYAQGGVAVPAHDDIDPGNRPGQGPVLLHSGMGDGDHHVGSLPPEPAHHLLRRLVLVGKFNGLRGGGYGDGVPADKPEEPYFQAVLQLQELVFLKEAGGRVPGGDLHVRSQQNRLFVGFGIARPAQVGDQVIGAVVELVVPDGSGIVTQLVDQAYLRGMPGGNQPAVRGAADKVARREQQHRLAGGGFLFPDPAHDGGQAGIAAHRLVLQFRVVVYRGRVGNQGGVLVVGVQDGEI